MSILPVNREEQKGGVGGGDELCSASVTAKYLGGIQGEPSGAELVAEPGIQKKRMGPTAKPAAVGSES